MDIQIASYTFKNGKFIACETPAGDRKFKTLDEVSIFLPAGVYTTFRTYKDQKVLFLSKHFDRLERSAQLINNPVYLDRVNLRRILNKELSKCSHQLARMRISITPKGEGEYDLYVLTAELQIPDSSAYEKGVFTITKKLKRENSVAKVTQFIKNTNSIRDDIHGSINEILMIDENGKLLEGFTSNIFCISDQEVWTAEKDILPGITRSAILQILQKMGIPVHFDGFPINQLAKADEIFITSTSRSVLPVTRIDDQMISNGKPGPITKKIGVEYTHFVEQNLEQL